MLLGEPQASDTGPGNLEKAPAIPVKADDNVTQLESAELKQTIHASIHAIWDLAEADPFVRCTSAENAMLQQINKHLLTHSRGFPSYVLTSKILFELAAEYCETRNAIDSNCNIHTAVLTSQLAVILLPDTHSDRPIHLKQLAISLQARFREHGKLSDLDEAISALCRAVDLTPGASARKLPLSNDLGNALGRRYDRLGNLSDLESSLAAQRRCVDQIPDSSELKPMYLNNLAFSLENRFKRLGNIADIEDALAALQLAIDIIPDGHASEPIFLSNLSNSLRNRFKRLGILADIQNAITAIQRAIDLSPDDNPAKSSYFTYLGNGLESRFETSGALSDIESAIVAHRRSVDLTPAEHPNLPVRLNNLGNSLQVRFARLGHLPDIEEAIATKRRAIDLTPDNHPSKALRLNNLGESLQSRFTRLGRLPDLDDAIATIQLAIELTPDSSPDKATRLNNLSSCFQRRFKELGSVSDLEDSIKAVRSAVDLLPDKHPRKPALLTSLGNSLQSHFERFDNIADIADAIAARRRVVDLTPDGHPTKPGRLNNLGICLRSRFERAGDIADLTNAAAAVRSAIGLTSDDHPSKLLYLNNLGNILERQYEVIGGISNLEDAIDVKRQAVSLTPEHHFRKPAHLNNLASCFHRRFQRVGDSADLEEAVQTIRRAVDLTPAASRERPAHLNNLGSSLIGRFKQFGDVNDVEEAITVIQSAIELAPDNHPEKAVYINSLGIALDERFSRLEDLADLESSIVSKRKVIELTPDDHPRKAGVLNNLGFALMTRFRRLSSQADVDESVAVMRHSVDLVPEYHPERAVCLCNFAIALETRHVMLKTPRDFLEAFVAYTSAVAHEPGLPSQRFYAAKRCVDLCSRNYRANTVDRLLYVYEYALPLIPEVAWLGHTINRRYDAIRILGNIVNGAAAIAILDGQITRAIEWLETGRSVIWSQILQLRAPLDELEEQYPELAQRLRHTSSVLSSTGSGRTSYSSPDMEIVMLESTEAEAVNRRTLAEEYKSILSAVREKKGFERFLLPQKLADITLPDDAGTIVIVNAHAIRCDALIIYSADRIVPIPLSQLTYALVEDMRTKMGTSLRRAKVRDRATKLVVRRSDRKPDKAFPWILERLWTLVVEPILLEVENNPATDRSLNSLPRITWCATGPLAFLPLHAAGVYDDSQNSSQLPRKAFKRVISSYTPSLSALAHRASKPSLETQSATNILVVSQAETPGFSPLPGTIKEVAKVKDHFPASDTAHLDGAAATVDAVLRAIDERSPRILHLACHGIQDPVDPASSAFMLHDGPLPLSSLMTRTADGAELAFLSACQTAAGDADLPEEAVHLAAGMLAVGYRSVIGTMWSIGDDDAPLVADEVYASLRAGESNGKFDVARALHGAVDRLREKVGEDSFLRWIPFVHFGH